MIPQSASNFRIYGQSLFILVLTACAAPTMDQVKSEGRHATLAVSANYETVARCLNQKLQGASTVGLAGGAQPVNFALYPETRIADITRSFANGAIEVVYEIQATAEGSKVQVWQATSHGDLIVALPPITTYTEYASRCGM